MSFKRTNWSKNEVWHPSECVYPSSLEELRQIIERARKEHKKIRAIGSLHSYNKLCRTNDIQLHTDKLCRVLTVDKQALKIKVEAGIKLVSLLKVLAENGLTLPNQGYITEQSIAGVIATATHGSGHTGTYSSFIEEIELLDAQGNLHILNPISTPHLFSAAVVNLGCLGIVYSVTLRCIPLGKLQLKKFVEPLSKVVEEIPGMFAMHDSIQYSFDPFSNNVLVWTYQKTDEPYQNRLRFSFWWYIVKALNILALEILPSPQALIPNSTAMYIHLSTFKSCINDSHLILSPADEGRYIEEEIAVPFEYTDKAAHIARELINRHQNHGRNTVALYVMRFVEPDIYGYLSPTLNRKSTYITLVSYVKEGYLDIFKEWEEALLPLGGRPHWGKIHFLTKEKIALLYGENYTRFKQAKQELDPEGLFSNEHIDALF